MAWHDWNGDDNNDLNDDMIEFYGYEDTTSSDDENGSQKYSFTNNNNGISVIGAILIAVAGMLGAGWICMTLNINSGIVIVILAIIFSLLLFMGYSAIKK